jgi:hypothetical protein
MHFQKIGKNFLGDRKGGKIGKGDLGRNWDSGRKK